MAITTTGWQAPATERVGFAPSVLDAVILLGADETPILKKVGRSVVKNYKHGWITDKLASPKKNAQLELSGFVGNQKATKQLTENATQIFTTEVMVTDSMQKMATYGGNELAHEVSKRGKEHALDLEYSFFGLGRDANVKTSVFKDPTVRTDTVAGEAGGIFKYCSKGTATFNTTGTVGIRGNVLAFDDTKNWSGTKTSMTWDIFNQVLEQIYKNGGSPKDVYVGTALKSAINGFVTRQLGNEKMANIMVSSLETDFGVVNIHLHRMLSADNGLDDVMLAGDFDFVKLGSFIDTNLKDVSTDKTATAKRYYTEATWEFRNADALAIGVGLGI